MSDPIVHHKTSEQPQVHNSTGNPNKPPIKRRPRVIERRTNTQHTSHLFRLPIELRLMIYELALCTPTLFPLQKSLPTTASPTQTFSNPRNNTTTTAFSPQEPHPATEPPFLSTCRLARSEALPVFYAHNDFPIHRRPSLDFAHPLFMSMNRTLLGDSGASKQAKRLKSSGTTWLYAMEPAKIAKIGTVLLTQFGRGMWKDEGEWRRDASACFRVRLFGGGGGGRRRAGKRGKGWDVQYVKVDGSGRSDRYAERLVKALEARMAQLVGEKGVTEWTREDIWDLAYLL